MKNVYSEPQKLTTVEHPYRVKITITLSTKYADKVKRKLAFDDLNLAIAVANQLQTDITAAMNSGSDFITISEVNVDGRRFRFKTPVTVAKSMCMCINAAAQQFVQVGSKNNGAPVYDWKTVDTSTAGSYQRNIRRTSYTTVVEECDDD